MKNIDVFNKTQDDSFVFNSFVKKIFSAGITSKNAQYRYENNIKLINNQEFINDVKKIKHQISVYKKDRTKIMKKINQCKINNELVPQFLFDEKEACEYIINNLEDNLIRMKINNSDYIKYMTKTDKELQQTILTMQKNNKYYIDN